MAYVDVNPIKEKMVKTLATSIYTSIKKRTESHKKSKKSTMGIKLLLPFKNDAPSKEYRCLPFIFSDYLALVDWSARQITQKNSW
jgi:REP-associated tyrosine transposase